MSPELLFSLTQLHRCSFFVRRADFPLSSPCLGRIARRTEDTSTQSPLTLKSTPRTPGRTGFSALGGPLCVAQTSSARRLSALEMRCTLFSSGQQTRQALWRQWHRSQCSTLALSTTVARVKWSSAPAALGLPVPWPDHPYCTIASGEIHS